MEETIKAMKRKIARDAIGRPTLLHTILTPWCLSLLTSFEAESDSDSEILAPTNRGNKLKQNAKFVREGKLGPPTGPAVYKQASSIGRLGLSMRVCSCEAVLIHVSRKSSTLGTDAP